MGVCSTASKTTLAVVNFFTIIAGTMLLGCAIYVHIALGLWPVMNTLVFGIYGLGGFTFLISLLGFCGTLKSSVFVIKLYSVLLTLTILAQIGFAVTALIAMNAEVTQSLNHEIDQQFMVLPTSFRHRMEDKLKCCGYLTPLVDCGYVPEIPTAIPQCEKKFRKLIISNIKVVAIIVFAVATIELFLALISFFMIARFKSEKKSSSSSSNAEKTVKVVSDKLASF